MWYGVERGGMIAVVGWYLHYHPYLEADNRTMAQSELEKMKG